MSEIQDRVERIRTLIKLMKALPDDLIYLLDSGDDPEVKRLVNEIVLELLQMAGKVQREIAARLVKQYVINQ
ncbi:MAG: hypothetical protein RQ868_11720 [Meiothermus sp.]|uniref:hypothetical protein n=1 Tax=Meiothermus sp. TaxID=1955249 RepID=UPI0028CC824C|nr:hypothetical protein [Meiothermus sp.]MDT7921240.1 hypothetical protein [Meiothermus sp.]